MIHLFYPWFIWSFWLKRSLWCRLAALQWRNAVLLLLISLFLPFKILSLIHLVKTNWLCDLFYPNDSSLFYPWFYLILWLKRSLWCRLAALQWRNAVLLLLISLFFAPLKYHLSLMLVKNELALCLFYPNDSNYFIHDFIWSFWLKRSLWCRLAALQWRNAVLLLLIRLFFAPLKYFL